MLIKSIHLLLLQYVFIVWILHIFIQRLCFSLRQNLTMKPRLTWKSLCRSGWPQVHSDLPSPASGVLGLKACTAISAIKQCTSIVFIHYCLLPFPSSVLFSILLQRYVLVVIAVNNSLSSISAAHYSHAWGGPFREAWVTYQQPCRHRWLSIHQKSSTNNISSTM